jgi:hypothetical protein
MAGLLHRAVELQMSVKWTSGLKLFSRLRDDIHESRRERLTVSEYVSPQILALSDPAWNRQPLTAYQQLRLAEIVDDRSNNLRPIWVTLNANDRAHADGLLGSALVDRLVDGALSVPCNWESYRHSRETVR